jgi:cytochrome c-type biogenesis protein
VSLSATQLAVAFAAGVVSIISPCVWPLVPGYLSLVSGVPARELEDRRAKVVGAATGFVAGFTVIFTLAGAGAGILGSQFLEHRRGLELIGGAIVIAMGIVMLAPRWITFLQRQARLPMQFGHDGALWAGLAGAAFAIGWTPCIGPVLAAILTFASQTGPAQGAALLVAYSLGLGVPFLIAGLATTSTLSALGIFKRNAALVNRIGGIVMVGAGVLLATGELTRITAELGASWNF